MLIFELLLQFSLEQRSFWWSLHDLSVADGPKISLIRDQYRGLKYMRNLHYCEN